MGRRIWVYTPETIRPTEDGGSYTIPEHTYDCRVLSFKQFLAAGTPEHGAATKRHKHLVQLWTDPGGMRTLTVGSIRLKDPNRAEGARRRAARERAEAEAED